MSRASFSKLMFYVALLAVPLEAVTVNPALCPTNKIAPHRRIANWQYGTGRTLGAFYDLLAPGNPQYGDAPNDLQEMPQEDDPDDCGEIEDYDENDLSSITSQANRNRRQGQGDRDSRGFFDQFFRPPSNPDRPPYQPERPPHLPNRPPYMPGRPPYQPDIPPYQPDRPPYQPERPPYKPDRPPHRPQRPPTTIRPQKPTYPAARPPYWSGGFFGSNEYRPPLEQFPSDDVKPIHENSGASQAPYRPSVVGGPLGHVVGVTPATPTRTTPRANYYNRLRQTTPNPTYPTRRPRSRNLNNNGIIGSFVDLLFK